MIFLHSSIDIFAHHELDAGNRATGTASTVHNAQQAQIRYFEGAAEKHLSRYLSQCQIMQLILSHRRFDKAHPIPGFLRWLYCGFVLSSRISHSVINTCKYISNSACCQDGRETNPALQFHSTRTTQSRLP